MDQEKKKRAKNFSEAETRVFSDVLLPKFHSIIECKQSDAVTRGEKATAWTQLTAEFNAISTYCFRTEDNLKNLWDKLKKDARKSKAHERRETFMTGGGARNCTGDPTTSQIKILEILGPSGAGLDNNCDGDGNPDADNDAVLVAAVPATVDDMGITEIDCSNIVVPDMNWKEYVPRQLYNPKPPAIRPCSSPSTTGSNGSMDSAPSPGPSGSGGTKKRTVAEEMEWAKQSKRRRPSLDDSSTKELNDAKTALTLATKARVEAENRRSEALHAVEIKKKESEAELAQLQVLKMKKELGLIP